MLGKLIVAAVMAVTAFALSASAAVAGPYVLEDSTHNPIAVGTVIEAQMEGVEGTLDGSSPNVDVHCNEAHIEAEVTDNGATTGTPEAVRTDAHESTFTRNGGDCTNSVGGTCAVVVQNSTDNHDPGVDHIEISEDPHKAGGAVMHITNASFRLVCSSGNTCVYTGEIGGKVDNFGSETGGLHATFPNPNEGDATATVTRVEGSIFFCPASGVLRGDIEIVEPTGTHLDHNV